MGRKSVFHDPVILDETLRLLALGVPRRVIAASLGIDVSVLSRLVSQKYNSQKLALKEVELSQEPIEAVRKGQPLAWLERKFREDFAPPKVKKEIEGEITVTFKGFTKREQTD